MIENLYFIFHLPIFIKLLNLEGIQTKFVWQYMDIDLL